MKDKKVAVVLSTYNGEKYVRDQLDSILNQTYKNIEIFVRDDGSKDSTVDIIKEYQKKNKNIKLVIGENLGFIKSFYTLLELSEGYEYYSFADQDDYWENNKLELLINELEKTDITKPCLAYSASDYYDEADYIRNYDEFMQLVREQNA